ncbi:flagellin N-terminal helical domain-containing protein [Altererythrobacter lutimaris]|uniref:Flagellar biosynthesis protein FlgL n=1 Tax=Altererythrobacter lutimaris TaxID=2743979 RepID=A0A850H6V4_9SPHN|nr:flagellar biosynthesis protein FlgL [Altererythrobacter lutimaris]NVE93310.1 flagellar biosynthesis protein FlgL [Altererythrobacter lutimaris]
MVNITNSTSAFYQRSLGQLGQLRGAAESLQNQIATGQRLERASDDPVASARLRTLSRMDRLADIDARNASRASDELSTAADGVESIADLVIRARELAIWAGNDTTSASERELIATEIDQLRETIFANANGFTNTGRSLFGGDIDGAAYSMDGVGNVTYVGAADSGVIDIGEGVTIERGITGPNILQFDNGGTTTDVFAFLADLTAALRGGVADPAAASRDAVEGLDGAIDSLGRAQAIYGARLAWIDSVQQTQTVRSEARAQEGGEIGGTDLSVAITQLQQTLTVLEASQASFARVTSLSLFDAI